MRRELLLLTIIITKLKASEFGKSGLTEEIRGVRISESARLIDANDFKPGTLPNSFTLKSLISDSKVHLAVILINNPTYILDLI